MYSTVHVKIIENIIDRTNVEWTAISSPQPVGGSLDLLGLYDTKENEFTDKKKYLMSN